MSSAFWRTWDVLWRVLAVELAMEGGVAMAKPLMEEKDEEEDQRRGSSMAGGLVLLQVPEPEEGKPVGSRFWHGGQGAWEAGQELPASERAWGKAPDVELLAPETNEELVQQLQREEIVMEEVQHGQDATTLVVVREATSPLMWGQLEGLGGPS